MYMVETSKDIIAREGITNANALKLRELQLKEQKLEEETIHKAEGDVEQVEEGEVPDIEGFVESVSITATINLGNYNNTKLEVSASSGEYARKVFLQEIGPTIEMVQGVIKRVNAR